MKRFLLACFAFLLAALHTGGAVAQGPSARALLLEGGSSCPASVRLTSLPTQYQCPAVSLQLASGTAWVKGTGFVPLSSLLSITNASGGYVTDWSGAMTWKFGPVTNLVTSFDYSSATYWGVTGLQTPTGGQIDPNGGTSAALLTETAGSSTHLLFGVGSNGQNFVSGTTYFQSFSSKQGTAQYIQLTLPVAAFSGAGYANVNLTNCTISASGGTFVAVGAVAQSNGYCRGWIAATATATTSAPAVGPIFINNNPSAARLPTYVGTGQTITATFPQVEAITYPTQTTPSPYVATTSGTATSTAQLRVANGTGLLSEDSRTNLTLWSQSMANAAWGKSNISATAASATAPDGTLTGELVARTSTVSSAFIVSGSAVTVTPSATYTLTRFAKPATIDGYYGIRFQGVYPIRADGFFNLNTCSVVGSSSSTFTAPSASATWVGSWCLLRLTFTVDAGTSSGTIVHGPAPGSATVSQWEAVSATLSNAYSWGGNFEQRATPTSYCPTTSAAATCSVDAVTATGSLDAMLRSPAASITASFNAASAQTLSRIFDENNGQLAPFITGSGALGLNVNTVNLFTTVNAITVNAVQRVAVGWSPSAYAMTLSGGAMASFGAASFTPGVSYIGNRASLDRALNGNIQRIDLWPQKLPDAVLQTISAPQPVLLTDFANGIYRWNGYDLGAAALPSLFSVTNSGGYCTTGAGTLDNFSSNTLRVCPGTGALPEDTRTNVNTNSSTLGAYNLQATTVTSDTTVAPDGTLTADTISDGVTNAAHFIQNGATFAYVNGTAYTISAYVLTSSYRYPQLTFPGAQFGATNVVTFDLQTGAVISPVLGTGVIVQYSNGWSRISFTSTASASGSGSTATLAYGGAGGGRIPAYTGANNTMVAWCVQTEAGTFPTSCMQTGGGTVTRNFDNIQALGPVLNLLGTQGANSMAMAWQGSQYYATGAAPARQYLANWSDTGNTRWSARSAETSGGAPNFIVGDGATLSQVPAAPTSVAAGTASRYAFRWSNSAADLASSTNGAAAQTAARQFGGTLGAPFYIGGNGGTSNQLMNTPLGCLAFFPGGLTNTQLQAPGVCQ